MKRENMDSKTMPLSSDSKIVNLGLAAPAIEYAPLPMLEVEGPEHIVGFVNRAFCQLVQKTREELIGKSFAEMIENGAKCLPLLDRVYRTGEFETHVEPDHSQAESVYWLYAMWPALGAGERPERIVIQLAKSPRFHETVAAMNEALLLGALRQHELREAAEKANARLEVEVAERRLTDTALRAANAGLEAATAAEKQANRAKDQFLATLSHELRTPLTPVILTAGALSEDERLPPDMRDQLRMMERNIALEARLIDDLLDLTRISHGKFELRVQPCDAEMLIGCATEIVGPEARAKNIVIEHQFEAHCDSQLTGDPTRLEQVFWNLVRNAVKFTPPGGKISVRTRDIEADDGTMWLQVEVADSGVGIDSSKLEQVFAPFDQGGATPEHRFGGLGLGLSIARTVVEMHGGRITAQSEGPNRGTQFVVDLPCTAAPRPRTTDAAGRDVGGATAGPISRKAEPLRLLIVEDHESTLQALSLLLRRDGHGVVTATSGAAALVAAELHPFDCVISDLGLPDGSGIVLMRKLRAAHGLRGIALTGYGMEEDLAAAREAGFIAHLVKPASIADIRRAIASVGETRR